MLLYIRKRRHDASSDVVRSARQGRRRAADFYSGTCSAGHSGAGSDSVRLVERARRAVSRAGSARSPGHALVGDLLRRDADIDASLAEAQRRGGKVVVPRTVMPDVTLGVFEDPEGHRSGSSKPRRPEKRGSGRMRPMRRADRLFQIIQLLRRRRSATTATHIAGRSACRTHDLSRHPRPRARRHADRRRSRRRLSHPPRLRPSTAHVRSR